MAKISILRSLFCGFSPIRGGAICYTLRERCHMWKSWWNMPYWGSCYRNMKVKILISDINKRNCFVL
jgi:hypothetical protein